MWGLHGVRKRKWLRRAASNGVGGLSWPRVILDAGVLIYIPRGGGASHAGFFGLILSQKQVANCSSMRLFAFGTRMRCRRVGLKQPCD